MRGCKGGRGSIGGSKILCPLAPRAHDGNTRLGIELQTNSSDINLYFAEVKTELQTVVVVVGIQVLEKPQKFEKLSCPVGSAQSLRKLSRNLWVYTGLNYIQ